MSALEKNAKVIAERIAAITIVALPAGTFNVNPMKMSAPSCQA